MSLTHSLFHRRNLLIGLGSLAIARPRLALACHEPDHDCGMAALLPLTGRFVPIGEEARAGIGAMADYLHTTEPSVYRNLRISLVDTEGRPSLTRELLSGVLSSGHRPSGVIAADFAVPLATLSELGARFEVPFISLSSYPPGVSSKWVYRIATDAVQVAAELPVAFRAAGAREGHAVNIVYTGPTAPRAKEFTGALIRSGRKVEIRITLREPTADLAPQMTEAAKASRGSGWVISLPMLGSGEGIGPIEKAIKLIRLRQGEVPIVVDGGGIIDPGPILRNAELRSLVVLSSFAPEPRGPLARPIYKRIRELSKGRPVASVGALAATAVQVLAQALVTATAKVKGNQYGKATRDALLRVSFKPDQLIVPWKGIEFDPKTLQNTGARAVPLVLRNGHIVVAPPA